MKIKNLITTLLAMVISVSLLAQSDPGVTLLRLGELELAKQHFMKTIRQQPANAHYYLGEVAWESGKIDEAKRSYADAISSNPESLLSQVGQAKAALYGLDKNSSEAKELKKGLEAIYKKNKKDIEVVLEVAKAFYDNNMEADGDKAVAEAKKSDKTSPLIYILEGDRFAKQGQSGDAARQYDQAINFDPNNFVALVKSGQVYEGINPQVATEQFEKAKNIDPNNMLISRYLAKVYSRSGRYAKAIELYTPYFLRDNFNVEDIRYFSTALYFNKNYPDAKEILEVGVQREKDNFVFNRLLMYTDNELKKYDEALGVAEHFFSLRAHVDTGYIDKDYMTYGQILAQNGRKDDALKAYDKAIELNPDNVALFKELASSMSSDKLHEQAAEYMSKYIDAVGEGAEATDYYALGRSYQSAGQALAKDSLPEVVEVRRNFYQKADQAYTVVSERLPDNYLGYFMRANANSLLDPEIRDGLAKPFYEKALEVIKANGEMEQRQAIVLTAYEYLSVYYLYQFDESKKAEDKEKSLGFCNAYLEINSDKASINQIKEILLQ